MWPLFSWAHLLVRTCLNAPPIHHIKKLVWVFKQALRKLNISSLKFEKISIFRHSNLHASFNEIVALNSTSQFVKGIFLHAVQLFSTVPRGPFLEAPGNYVPGPLSCFVFHSKGSFKRFENFTGKLSAKETKWTSSGVRSRPSFLETLISKSDSRSLFLEAPGNYRALKLFCSPFQTGVSNVLKIVQWSYQLKKQNRLY